MPRFFSHDSDRNVVLLGSTSHLVSRFFELLFPILAIQLARELHLPLTVALSWSFLGYLLFGLGALPAQWIARRLGARPALLVGLAGMGVSALAAAEATPGRGLSVCLASLGLFVSCAYMAGVRLMSAVVPGRARVVNALFGNVGIALTPVLATLLIDRFGTRHAFHVVGLLVCALAAVLSFVRVHEPRMEHRIASPDTIDLPNQRVLFALLCLCAMLTGVVYRGIILVQPAYFAERVSLVHLGIATSFAYAMGIIGQYFVGRLTAHFDLRARYLAFHMVSLTLLLLMSRLAGMPLVMMVAVLMMVCFGMPSLEDLLFVRFAPSRWRASAPSLRFVLTFGAGSTAVWLVPQVNRGDGLGAMFVYLAGVTALVVVTVAVFTTASAGEIAREPSPAAKMPAGEPAV